ncbi:MAG: urea ABC transporter permease subunit UrtC [bacterium]|nr:urea ABC transporter permease subunit UrtC [bacterium]
MPAWKSALYPSIILALLLVLALPMLNVYGMISDYALNLYGKYLALAVLALGMNLIWGYTGILSLGQAIFFGLGAYGMGMHLMLESSGKGVYGETIPDFMVWNRLTELPFYWVPFKSFPFAVVASILVPALAAAIVGFLTFRRRVGGTYFAILTQAMAFATWLMFNRNELNLGGTNGLTDFKTILGFSLSSTTVSRNLYITTAFLLVVSFFLCRWLVGSKMGLVLTAIRDQEPRLRFLGYPIAQYKIFIFSLAGALAGLAGALYVPQAGIITPNQIGVLPSLEIVVWVATGGRNSLLGGIIGAVGINAARSVLTAEFPEWWPIILGSLFVTVVLLLPNGVVGLPRQCLAGMRRLAGKRKGPTRLSTTTPAQLDQEDGLNTSSHPTAL